MVKKFGKYRNAFDECREFWQVQSKQSLSTVIWRARANMFSARSEKFAVISDVGFPNLRD